MQFLRSYWWLFLLMAAVILAAIIFIPDDYRDYNPPGEAKHGFEWNAPDIIRVPSGTEGDLVRYGRELVINTSVYFGPKGKIAAITNGMNCQNCHLDAGERTWGNNFSAVSSTYPKFRPRSGLVEGITSKINECFTRSLSGQPIDTLSHEMQAIHAYIKWLGSNVPKDVKPYGALIADLPFIDRAADTSIGKNVYVQKCSRCHAFDGQGTFNVDSTAYQYPPLWGPHSFNAAATLYRVSKMAGFIKYNMPFDIGKENVEEVTLEEAWDVAAFINSQPRPHKIFPGDWPNISIKPFDLPFGPYSDSFSEAQHKYGPFGPIAKAGKKK